MKLPVMKPNDAPQHNIGDSVWVISRRQPTMCNVLSIKLELCSSGKANDPVLLCMGYRLNTLNVDSKDWSFRPHEVYASKELAEKLAQWHPVSDLSEEEWKMAIGVRDDDESLEECELSRCCATISSARNILLKCQKDGGLIERDVQSLCALLSGHGYPKPGGQRPANLDKIVGQLGILSKFPADLSSK